MLALSTSNSAEFAQSAARHRGTDGRTRHYLVRPSVHLWNFLSLSCSPVMFIVWIATFMFWSLKRPVNNESLLRQNTRQNGEYKSSSLTWKKSELFLRKKQDSPGRRARRRQSHRPKWASLQALDAFAVQKSAVKTNRVASPESRQINLGDKNQQWKPAISPAVSK